MPSSGPSTGFIFLRICEDRGIESYGQLRALLNGERTYKRLIKQFYRAINLIDVLWLKKGTNNIISAFEVEESTSIYSGILRLSDLSLSAAQEMQALCLVAPNQCEKEVVLQLKRPPIIGNAVPI